MTTAIIRTRGSSFRIFLGLYRGYTGIMEKQNGNCYSILGLYWDNGKETGNCFSIFRLYWDTTLE